MAVSDVIFLGAGASASEGAPVQKELFSDFFNTDKGYDHNSVSLERLKDFFDHFFGIDIRSENESVLFPSFEETMGLLEIAIDRGESFRGYPSSTRDPDIQSIREDLIFLIALVLNRTLMAPKGHHKALVRRLEKEGCIDRTAFISLNYDILIDNELTELYPEYDLDYGVEFTNYTRENDWEMPRNNKSVALYKLHGSLNWLYCPTCVSLTLTPRERKVALLVEKPVECSDCGTHAVPIIIPPTFFKGMQNYYLQQIMRKSEMVLKDADRLFFCGYSFPDADLLVRYLLKRVELNHNSTPEIYVINDYEGKQSQQKIIEKQRFMRFFRHKDRVHYLELSFKEFCTRGIYE
jgi:hypothetical protein